MNNITKVDFEFWSYIEKLNNNASLINAYFSGKETDGTKKVFIPFCDMDDELIPLSDFKYDSLSNHKLDIDSNAFKVHNGYIDIIDVFTQQTLSVSTSPNDLDTTISTLDNIFINPLLIISTVKNYDHENYVKTENEYGTSEKGIVEMLKLPDFPMTKVPSEITAYSFGLVIVLITAIFRYVQKMVSK